MTMQTTKPVIHLATDHAGFVCKEGVKGWLVLHGYEVIDHGAYVEEAGDDFPDFIAKAAQAVSKDPEHSRGVIFGGSGQGEAMVANRFPRVRATVFYGGPREIITLSREHNNANVLSFGARFLSLAEAIETLEHWLTTHHDLDDRHRRRIQKLEVITRDLHV